jgi:hypothetical protein
VVEVPRLHLANREGVLPEDEPLFLLASSGVSTSMIDPSDAVENSWFGSDVLR